MNFICDTDILSCIGKIKRFDILNSLFPSGQFLIPDSVKQELTASSMAGHTFPDDVFSFVSTTSLTEPEGMICKNISRKDKSLGNGEIECIAIAISRGWFMLSNDSRAGKAARSRGVTS